MNNAGISGVSMDGNDLSGVVKVLPYMYVIYFLSIVLERGMSLVLDVIWRKIDNMGALSKGLFVMFAAA